MDFSITPLGDAALMIEFQATMLSDKASEFVHSAYHLLSKHPVPGMIALVPAYTTLTLHYEPSFIKSDYPYQHMKIIVQELLRKGINTDTRHGNCFLIPVCYELPFSLDLTEVAQAHHLTEEEVIHVHTKQIYHVSFLGFSPGFPFLSGLSQSIATPRKENPRTLVKAGSVGIAGEQTGIYPTDSPGGWQIIGQTPIRIYFPEKKEPTLFAPGDTIRFYAITAKQYYQLEESHEYNCS
ncbi:5-oxoprolinase subunit PxpB [Robertmurraya korlensis]|uniref:5-oxoprolinase subunit PxpB n=1 Tax=Robertmurraya korlensis TaxID=519977 RepID=UPI002040E1D2|nr:5-oxoprolinase subunit PxpB [Robertmurraya korlensis]